MNHQTHPLCAILMVFTGSFCTASGQEAVLKAEPVVKSALAGVPVVVALTYANETSKEVSVPQPVGRYLLVGEWHWKSAGGGSWRITFKDLHYALLPNQGLPPRITLDPGEKRTWYVIVPTPESFGNERAWTLEVTMTDLNPIGPTLKKTTVSARFSCKDAKGPSVVGSLGFSLAQAAVDPRPTRISEKQWQLIGQGHTQGDLAATLILFSDAVRREKEIWPYWERMDQAPAEMRCVRNCVLWMASTQRRWNLPEDEREKLLQDIADADGPFIAMLRKNLQQRAER